MEDRAAEIIFNAGASAAGSQDAANGDYVVVPEGSTLHDLEPMADAPRRISNDVRTENLDSFKRYCEAYATKASRVFVTAAEIPEVTCVLDYHASPEEPGWMRHAVRYRPRASLSWRRWFEGLSETVFTQEQLAQFLRNARTDIVIPEAAVLIEAVRDLQAVKTTGFRSAVNLGDGTIQFQVDQAIRGAQGQIVLPAEFQIHIPWAINEEMFVDLIVRLVYRLQDDGKVAFRLAVDRGDEIKEAARKDWLARVLKMFPEAIQGTIET